MFEVTYELFNHCFYMDGRGSNPGGGDSHIKMTGVLVVPFRG